MTAPPPVHLSEPSRELWGDILARFDLSPWELRLLGEALNALDRAEQARVAVGDRIVVATKDGSLKPHPALTVERDSRASFARMLRQLGLDEVLTPSPHERAAANYQKGRRR